MDEKWTERLIEWVLDVFGKLLVKIVARRDALKPKNMKRSESLPSVDKTRFENDINYLDEVKEVIDLPKFDVRAVQAKEASIILSSVLMEELKDFIVSVASLYRDNRFHCFDHAVHVTMVCRMVLV
jgi:hypothetical protein